MSEIIETAEAVVKYKLIPQGSGIAGPLNLTCPGKLILGRSLLASSDSRCSRKQIEITCLSSGKVTIELLGSNYSSIKQPSQQGEASSSFQPLCKNQAVSITNGCEIAVLGSDFVYKLVEETTEPDAKKQRQSSPISFSTTQRENNSALPWCSSIASYAHNPERYPGIVVNFNEKVVIIRDRFPKSKIHLLAVSRDINDAPSLPLEIRKRHLPGLKIMFETLNSAALSEIERMKATDEEARIKFGFHMAPSLKPMHLHAISQDFSGEALKTAKHWNSFTSKFFVEIGNVISALESSHDDNESEKLIKEIFGNSEVAKSLLKSPLRCHRCGCSFPFIPRLKEHIKDCKPGQKSY